MFTREIGLRGLGAAGVQYLPLNPSITVFRSTVFSDISGT